MAKKYSKGKKVNNKKKKRILKKYSLSDRLQYYSNKTGANDKAFAAGYKDLIFGARLDSSVWEGREEFYVKGFEQASKTIDKLYNIKF